jgi:predicted transposase/invertase (TIGR01784 family)
MGNINPRIDLAFKKLFGVEENKDLLISLINSIVSQDDQIVDVELLNPYNPRSFKEDKLSILDIKAKDEQGRYYNIEIQISDEADYDKRALYYWAKLYTEQLRQSHSYAELRKAIGIHILNFISIPGVEEYHNVFHLIEKKSGAHYFKDIELHTIELSKFENDNNIDISTMLNKIKNSLDRWAAFLTRNDYFDVTKLPPELDDPQIKKAFDIINVMGLGKEEREAYEARLEWWRFEISAFTKFKSNVLKEGALIIAKNLLAKGVETNFIAEVTGLTVEEIKNISDAQ